MQDTVPFESVPHRDFVLVFEGGVGTAAFVAALLALAAVVAWLWLWKRRREQHRRQDF
jgi:hypothetical protein